MKKINIILFAILLVFIACDNDQEQLFDKIKDPTRPTLSIEGVTTFIVDEEHSDMYYSTLQWTPPHFGKNYSAGYTIEVSNEETFSGSIESIAVENNSTLYSLNATLLSNWAMEIFGIDNPETGEKDPSNLFFRIKAVEISPEGIINEQKIVYSNVETIYAIRKGIEIPEELTIHFKPTTNDWEEYAVYGWGDAEVYGAWPGLKLEASPEGWYTIVVPSNRPINLIINNNNNGKQFDFLKDPTVDACYEIDINNGSWTEVECPEITVVSSLYMIGDEFGDWNWASEDIVEMIPVNGFEKHYWCIRYISSGKGFKWNTQKEWGGDFNSLGEDIGFTTSDGNAFVAQDGLYMVYVDMQNNKISVEPAKVFGMGDCFGGWDTATYPFAKEDRTMTYTTTGTGELRIYAASDISPAGNDWWRMEFVILDGKIAYRGNGGDQERLVVDAGKKITLDFNAGTGNIE